MPWQLVESFEMILRGLHNIISTDSTVFFYMSLLIIVALAIKVGIGFCIVIR